MVVTWGLLGIVVANWLTPIDVTECGSAGSCSGALGVFPWLAIGLAGGAVVGVACAVGFIQLFRVTGRALHDLAGHRSSLPGESATF